MLRGGLIHARRMRRAIESFHDGELPEAKAAILTEHLRGCPECAGLLRRLKESDRLLSGARPTAPAMPPAARQILLQRALAEAGAGDSSAGSGSIRAARWVAIVGVLAGLVVATLMAVWTLGRSGDLRSPALPRVAVQQGAGAGAKQSAAVAPGDLPR